MNKLVVLSIALILFSSCVKTVDNVELPEIKPQMVAQSFLEVNKDTIILFLSSSNPIFYATGNYNYRDIKDANVFITYGAQKLQLSYKAPFNEWESGYYYAPLSSFGLEANKSYGLQIDAPTFETVYSNCILPTEPEFKVELKSIDSIIEEWGGRYKFNFNFTALNEDLNNYYHISALGYYNEAGYLYQEQLYTYTDEEGFLKLSKNQLKSLSFEVYNGKPDSIQFHIFRTDLSYYNYHKSVRDFDGENPFSEPVIIYSNIENGLGVFCGFNRKLVTIKF